MYAESSLWITAPPEEVFATITDPATWPEWLAGVTAHDLEASLDRPGYAVPGTIRFLHRSIDVDWHVVARVRDTVRLRAVADGATVAEVRISCSPWDGGCATELSVDSTATALPSDAVTFHLRRSIRRLARLIEARRTDPSAPRVGGRRRLVVMSSVPRGTAAGRG